MKRLLTATILASSLAAGAAFAQGTNPWYVGASVGQSNYSTDSCVGQCDKTDIGMKIFGGYLFNEYIGAELAWGAYGSAKINTVEDIGVGQPVNLLGEVKSSGFSGFLVGQFPIDQFRLFGKVGFSYLDTKLTATVPIQPGIPLQFSDSQSDRSFEFAWGVGATWMVNSKFGVRAEYEAMKYKIVDTSNTLSFWSIGVQYHF
jgi:OOP family OmpA-OmpF porin